MQYSKTAKNRRPKNEPTIITERIVSRNKQIVPVCGTAQGYNRHLRNGEYADEACLKAYAIQRGAERGSVTEGVRNPLIQCGTAKGYSKHRRQGTIPCQPCIDAYIKKHTENPVAISVTQQKASLLEKHIKDGAYLIRPREFDPADAQIHKAIRPPISLRLINIIKAGGDVRTYKRKGER